MLAITFNSSGVKAIQADQEHLFTLYVLMLATSLAFEEKEGQRKRESEQASILSSTLTCCMLTAYLFSSSTFHLRLLLVKIR